MIRRLVITADDFGLAPGVDSGIIDAAAAGSVTAVSVIVNLLPANQLAARIARLRLAAPYVGVGLHFNCTAGRPLTSAPTLTRRSSGEFLSLPELLMRALTGRLYARDVADECAAQLDALAAVAGRISHIDSHRHVHTLPGIWTGVTDVARRYKIPHVRLPIEAWRLRPLDVRATARKAFLRSAMYVAARKTPATVDRTSRFVGISLHGNRRFSTRLLHYLDRLPAGTTELMVHPGFVDPEVRRHDGYVNGREIELRALLSDVVRERLTRGDIVLTQYGVVHPGAVPLEAQARR